MCTRSVSLQVLSNLFITYYIYFIYIYSDSSSILPMNLFLRGEAHGYMYKKKLEAEKGVISKNELQLKYRRELLAYSIAKTDKNVYIYVTPDIK